MGNNNKKLSIARVINGSYQKRTVGLASYEHTIAKAGDEKHDFRSRLP